MYIPTEVIIVGLTIISLIILHHLIKFGIRVFNLYQYVVSCSDRYYGKSCGVTLLKQRERNSEDLKTMYEMLIKNDDRIDALERKLSSKDKNRKV